MEFRRKVGFGLSIAALGIMASSLLVGPAGLQQGELEIWVAKTYVEQIHGEPPVIKTYPWATLLNEFNRNSRRLSCASRSWSARNFYGYFILPN
jgi:hypothetical protein